MYLINTMEFKWNYKECFGAYLVCIISNVLREFMQKSWIWSKKKKQREKSNTRNRKKIQVSRVCKCSRWRSFPYHIRSFCNFVHTHRESERAQEKEQSTYPISTFASAFSIFSFFAFHLLMNTSFHYIPSYFCVCSLSVSLSWLLPSFAILSL